ncbi:MAG: hypothetical protein IKS48_03755 [Eubacterium sp.]|nr:hypothetical protein [Eubacterium sp.]
MLTLLFIILMFSVCGSLVHMAFRLAWGVTKVLFAIVFFPVILVGLAFTGFIYISIILLVIVGIISLIRHLVIA